MILAFVGMHISCSESYINLAPISDPNVASYYKSQSDFKTAIVGVYNSWQGVFPITWNFFLEFRSDTYDYTGTFIFDEISNNHFQLNTTSDPWDKFYRIISYSNMILDRIDNVEFTDESSKKVIKAEARFFRGWTYFTLIRFFGAVPLIEHEISSIDAIKIGRTDVGKIFSFIEDDLKFAINNLPSNVQTTDYGRITKYAAEGILANVYITQSGKVYNTNRWSDAKPLLEDIVNNSPYKFANTYQEIFARDASNEKGKEIILSALFKAGTDGEASSYLRSFCNYYGKDTDIKIAFEKGLVESYENGDIRREVNISRGSYNDLEGKLKSDPTNIKFNWGFDIKSQTDGIDWPVLRYTDVYLLYAETLSEIAGSVPNESLVILNKVRNRAGLPSLRTIDVPDLASYRMALEKERRSELMFECVRWFDLVRTGRAVDVLKALGKNADKNWLLFPIPQTEIDKLGSNLLPQNPGY